MRKPSSRWRQKTRGLWERDCELGGAGITTGHQTLNTYRLLHVNFIHKFLLPYRERASLRASEPYGSKNDVSYENACEV